MTYPFSAGEILTAANLNLVTVPDSVTTWSTPIFGGLTAGNGTTTASYIQAGKIVVASFRFVFGSTSAVTGDIGLTLPVTSITKTPAGSGTLVDTSAGSISQALIIQASGTTVVTIKALVASATYTTTSACSSTIPFTWATTDEINVTFTYLAA